MRTPQSRPCARRCECGDPPAADARLPDCATIAVEAQQGTLRYLLIRPVGRTHLRVAKPVAAMAFVVVTVLVVAVTAYAVGVLLLGDQTVTVTP